MTQWIKILLFLAVAVVVVAGGWSAFPLAAEEPPDMPARPTLGLSLDNAIGIVLQRSPMRVIADAGMQATVEGKKSARGEFFPKLRTTLDLTVTDELPLLEIDDPAGNPLEPIPVGSKEIISSQTTIEQPIFTGLALLSQYELADLENRSADVNRREVQQQLILKTYEASFGILIAEKGLEVAEQAVTQLESHAEVARQFFENGMMPKNDMLKSLVTLAEAKQARIEAVHDLELAWTEFSTLLRFELDPKTTHLTEPLARRPYARSLDECVQAGLQFNPQVALAGLDVRKGKKAITMARSEFYPNLAIVGMFLHEKGGFITDPEQWSGTLHTEWNVWEWGSSYYKVQQKKAELVASKAERTRKLDHVKLQVRAAFLEWRESSESIDVAQATIEQAEENYRITIEQYNENITTSTEVLDAQVLQARARMNYYNALARYNLAIARLEKAMGILGEPDNPPAH